MNKQRREIEYIYKELNALSERVADVVEQVVGSYSAEDVLESNFYPQFNEIKDHLKAIYFIAFDDEMTEL